MAKVNSASLEATKRVPKLMTRPGERAPKKCKFAEVIRCTGSQPPWLCKAFGDKTPVERSRIIKDTKLCPFCLLHGAEEVFYSKTYKTQPFCTILECKEFHI